MILGIFIGAVGMAFAMAIWPEVPVRVHASAVQFGKSVRRYVKGVLSKDDKDDKE